MFGHVGRDPPRLPDLTLIKVLIGLLWFNRTRASCQSSA
jgi:hypothetical protein